jgi:hypothetical protein
MDGLNSAKRTTKRKIVCDLRMMTDTIDVAGRRPKRIMTANSCGQPRQPQDRDVALAIPNERLSDVSWRRMPVFAIE